MDEALPPRVLRTPASVTRRLVHEAEDARDRSKVVIFVPRVAVIRDLPNGFKLLRILLDDLPGDAGSGVGAGVLLQASITRPLPLQALVTLGRGEGDWQRVSVGHRLSRGLGDGGGGPSLYRGTVLPAENKCQKRIISKVTKVFRRKDIF